MGVKDLWFILAPISKKKSLWDFQDQSIAIDLSSWVCDSQNVCEASSQRNMYLRNLFFRTSHLLLQGILPVFVLEGTAPELKHNKIEQRKNAKSKKPSSNLNYKKGDRRRLTGLQNKCAELLTSLGVPFVKSIGEAESLCAALNEAKLVAGAISQDSDCFLYGARTVFRNFSSSTAGSSVDIYDMDVIERKLNLGRNKLIALSLLLGCDYNDNGVAGIGKEIALKFLEDIEDCDILPRLQAWRTNSYLDLIENNKKFLAENPSLKLEVKIRQKALKDPEFPSADVISEFLEQKECVKNFNFSWKKPNLNKFLVIAIKQLCWEESYALEKIIPILSRWHLKYGAKPDGVIELEKIVKRRKIRGTAGFEIMWKPYPVATIEPENLVLRLYADLVAEFVELNTKGKKKQNSKRKKVLQDISNTLGSPIKNTQKKVCEKTKVKEKGVQTLDKFLVKLKELSLHESVDSEIMAKNEEDSFNFFSNGYETYYYQDDDVEVSFNSVGASSSSCGNAYKVSLSGLNDNDFYVLNTQCSQPPTDKIEEDENSSCGNKHTCPFKNSSLKSEFNSGDGPRYSPLKDNLNLSSTCMASEKEADKIKSCHVFGPSASTPLVSKTCNFNLSLDFENPQSLKKNWISKFSQNFSNNESISTSDFECEADNIPDLSDIIDSIVNKKESGRSNSVFTRV